YINKEPKMDTSGNKIIKYHEFQGDIEFKDVTFAYPTRPEAVVLKHFNLKIPAARTVAIVGLTKEVKEEILDEYQVPSNCEFLFAPTLNPEAKVALSDPLVKRDSFLMQKQKQLGVALAALASATTLILANETSKQKLLKPISDACRILCDNHYIDTKSRRNLVISSTNTKLKDTLIESVRDKSWLFGENISEKLRTAKTIQKSGDDLKNHFKPTVRPNYPVKNNKNRLNYKRKTDNRPLPSAPIVTSADSGRGRHQWRAPPRGGSLPQRGSTRRSPPARRAQHKLLWEWCKQRGITVFASYINTNDNCDANQLSRKKFQDTEWELNDNAFRQIVTGYGYPEIDLFASRRNAKCHIYVTWKMDPEAKL
ncbi:hypothetical protein evm_014687, partial [Chilo suppressalis]